MKNFIIFLGFLALTSLSYAATNCPCPGPCCPIANKTNNLTNMTDYLSPWATPDKMEKQMEHDITQHRVHSR